LDFDVRPTSRKNPILCLVLFDATNIWNTVEFFPDPTNPLRILERDPCGLDGGKTGKIRCRDSLPAASVNIDRRRRV